MFADMFYEKISVVFGFFTYFMILFFSVSIINKAFQQDCFIFKC